jgi:MATE family multidrug resistance protein
MGAMTNLVAFYLVGMPLAILFSFRLKFYTKVVLLRRINFF